MKPDEIKIGDPETSALSASGRILGESVIKSPTKSHLEPSSCYSLMTYLQSSNQREPPLPRNPSVIRKNSSSNQISELPVGSRRQDSEPLPKKRRLLELVDCNENHQSQTIAFDPSLVPTPSLDQISSLCQDAHTKKLEHSNGSNDKINLSCSEACIVPISEAITTSISTTCESNKLIFPTPAGHKASESNVNTEVYANTLSLEKVDLAKESDVAPNTSSIIDNNKKLPKTREEVTTSTGKIISSYSLLSSSKSESMNDLSPKMMQRKIDEQPVIPNLLAKKGEQEMDNQDILATACHAVGLDRGLMDISDVSEEINLSTSTRNIVGCHKPCISHAPKATTLTRSSTVSSRKESVPNSSTVSNERCQNAQNLHGCGPYALGSPSHYLHPYRYINSTVMLPNRFPQPSNPYAYSNPYYRYPYSSTVRNYPGTYVRFRPPDSHCFGSSANRINFPGNPRPMTFHYRSPLRHPTVPPYQIIPQNSHLRSCRYESTAYPSNEAYYQTPVNPKPHSRNPSISPQGAISPNTQMDRHPKYSQQLAVKALNSTTLSPTCHPPNPEYSTTREEFYNHNQRSFLTQIPPPLDENHGNIANKRMMASHYFKTPESTYNSKAEDVDQNSNAFYSRISNYQEKFSMQTDPNECSKSVIGGNVNMQGQFIIEKVRKYSYPPYRYSEWKVPTYSSSTSESIKDNPTQPTTYSNPGSQDKRHVTSQNYTNNDYHATYSSSGNISNPHMYKNETCTQSSQVYNHYRTELPYYMPKNSYPMIKPPPSQVPSTVTQNCHINREKIGAERLQESIDNQLKSQNTVSAISHTYIPPCQPYSPDVPFTTAYTSSSNPTNINSTPLGTTDINMDGSYYTRDEESYNVQQYENSYTLSPNNSNNDSINYEIISPRLADEKTLDISITPDDFMPPLRVPESYTNQVSCNLSKTTITESGTLDTSLMANGISSELNSSSTSTVCKPTSESDILNRNDIFSPPSCMSQKASTESSKQNKTNTKDKPVFRTSATSKHEEEHPVEDNSKRSPLDSSELAIGSFLLNKGYATFMDAGVESKESLFKQKLLPVIDHLLSIPEAASLRPLRFCPDQLLEHLVKQWGGKDANSTAADCYLRMKENFLSLVKFLFKPHQLVEWGWDKAFPEQILEELLSSSEQGDLFSQTTFGNLCRSHTTASASSSLSVSISPQGSSSEDDVFSAPQSLPYNSLSEADFHYLNTVETTTGRSDSGATENTFLKDIISNGVLNNDKGDNSLSNSDKRISSFITKTNSNFCPLSGDNSSTTDKGFSRQSNEINPNLSRIEDMIPCILEENLEVSKKLWSSKIEIAGQSPTNSGKIVSVKSFNPFKENCKASVCESEIEIYSRETSNSLFNTKDCSTELSPDMKNKKRKSLEEVEKTLNNQLNSYCSQSKTTEYRVSTDSPKNNDVFQTQVDREAEWKELTEHLIEFKQSQQHKIIDPADLQFRKKDSPSLNSISTKEIEGKDSTETSQSVQTNFKPEEKELNSALTKTLSCDNPSVNSCLSTKESAICKDKMITDRNISHKPLNSPNNTKSNIKSVPNIIDSVNETKINETNRVQCRNPMSEDDPTKESCAKDPSSLSTNNSGEKKILNGDSHVSTSPPNMDNLGTLEENYATDINATFPKGVRKGDEMTENNLPGQNLDKYFKNCPYERDKRITETKKYETPDISSLEDECNQILSSRNPTETTTKQDTSSPLSSTSTAEGEGKTNFENTKQSTSQNISENISKPSVKISNSSNEINTSNIGHLKQNIKSNRFDSPNPKKDFDVNSKPFTDYTSIFEKYIENKLLTSNDIKAINPN